MVDSVSIDMRLNWPGQHSRTNRSRYADGDLEQTPFFNGRE
jgi:hypothetical protein